MKSFPSKSTMSVAPNLEGPGTLEGFMIEMQRLTGFRVCLYDISGFTEDSPGLKLLSNSLRAHTAPVCELIKSNPEMCDKCVSTENFRSHEAVKHPLGFVHKCFAGVVDYIVPLSIHGKCVGAVMIGQAVAIPPERLETLCRKLSKLGFPLPDLKEQFGLMPYANHADLVQAGKLLMLLKAYIERTEELLAIGREYNFLLSDETPTAEEAVRLGKLPFRRLHLLRSRLHGNESEPIRKVLDLVQECFSSNFKLEEVARQVGMSVSHLSREFHRQTGTTFRQIVLETRLGSALFLIKKYDVSISEAAYQVGYSDEFSFRRAFRKLTKLSPRTFLKRFPRAFDVIE